MNLDLIKLLDDEPDVTEVEVNEYLEHLVQQGTGWGMRQLDRIALTLARVARDGLEASNKLDEAQRALKGQQLENGRIRKRMESVEQQLAALRLEKFELDKAE